MRLTNVLSGLILVGAMGGGCATWAATHDFVTGSVVFIVGALLAGALKGDKRRR